MTVLRRKWPPVMATGVELFDKTWCVTSMYQAPARPPVASPTNCPSVCVALGSSVPWIESVQPS